MWWSEYILEFYAFPLPSKAGPVAQWITRLPTEQTFVGSRRFQVRSLVGSMKFWLIIPGNSYRSSGWLYLNYITYAPDDYSVFKIPSRPPSLGLDCYSLFNLLTPSYFFFVLNAEGRTSNISGVSFCGYLVLYTIYIFAIKMPVRAHKNCRWQWYFTSSRRGIG
jgi:hypothetical protein